MIKQTNPSPMKAVRQLPVFAKASDYLFESRIDFFSEIEPKVTNHKKYWTPSNNKEGVEGESITHPILSNVRRPRPPPLILKSNFKLQRREWNWTLPFWTYLYPIFYQLRIFSNPKLLEFKCFLSFYTLKPLPIFRYWSVCCLIS